MLVLLLVPASRAGAALLQPAPARRALYPALATGPGGGAVAWRYRDALHIARLAPDGRRRGAVLTLARGAIDPNANLSLAVDAHGAIVVAWLRSTRETPRCCAQVWAAVVGRHGGLGRAQPLSVDGLRARDVSAGIGGGRAVVAWDDADGLHVAGAGANRRFGPPRTAAPVAGTEPVVAVDAHGSALISWFPDDPDRIIVTTASWSRHGRWRPLGAPSFPGLPVISAGPATRVLVDQLDSGGSDLLVSRSGGPWSAPQRLRAPWTAGAVAAVGWRGDAVVAVQAAGRLGLTWLGRGSAFGAPHRVADEPAGASVAAVAVQAHTAAIALTEQGSAILRVVISGPTRSVRTVRWRSVMARQPEVALVDGHLLVAFQTPRGLELARVAAHG